MYGSSGCGGGTTGFGYGSSGCGFVSYGSLGAYSGSGHGNSYASNSCNLERIVLDKGHSDNGYTTAFLINTPNEVQTIANASYREASRRNYSNGTYLMNSRERHYFVPDVFLRPDREPTEHITDNKKIMPLVKEAFKLLAEKDFPEENIKITVCSESELKALHEAGNNLWDNGIQGFSINRFGSGVSEIFVKDNELDRLMLTIGHEIGHVMSPALGDARDEEAKAFAFSLAWMETLAKHNIAGLRKSIAPMPARNGLHDAAFDFVMDMAESGKKAMQMFLDLANGVVSINRRMERIVLT